MFVVRRLFQTKFPVRWVGDEFESVFKTYLQQAEEIEKKAKEKLASMTETKENDKLKTSIPDNKLHQSEPKAPIKSEIEVYFDECQIIKKLGSAESPEKMQITLEEQLLNLNQNYYKNKNLKEKNLSCSDFLLKLQELWVNTPEITIKEITFATLVRTVWIQPLTKTSVDFGEFKRITKDQVGQHSPFIYGPLSDSLYQDLALAVGNEKVGIRLIRRVLDHMAAYNHTPSKDLVQILIEECILGKWPRALFTTITYAAKKDVNLPHKVWVSVLNYFRYNQEFSNRFNEILDLSFKHGALPTFDTIQLYINLSLNLLDQGINDNMNNPTILIDKLKDRIQQIYQDPIERTEKICELSLKFTKYLISIDEIKIANEYISNFLEKESYSPDAIEVTFKFHEELKDSFKALKAYKKIVNNPSFIYTPKIIVSILRMCSVLGEPCFDIVQSIEELILNDKKLCTPFAINTIVVCYAISMKWDNIMDFMSKCLPLDVTFNKYTGPTIRKLCAECPDLMIKNKLIEQAGKVDERVSRI